jgi:hypothetical protein
VASSRTPRPVVSRETINRAAQSPAVRRALQMKRDRVLARAQRLAIAAGLPEYGRSLRGEDGTRPGTRSPTGIKRPFSRVIATSADATSTEYGDQGVQKRAILRRSMGA